MNCFSLTPKFPTVLRILSIFAFALIWTLSPAATRTAQAQPAFSTSFSPNEIGSGGTTTLTYTIDNASGVAGVTSMAFANTLPVDVTIANPASASTTCSGPSGGPATFTAPDGGTAITFSDGRLAVGTSCTASVNVTSSVVAGYTNTTGDLTSSAGNSGTASSSLTVATTRPGFAKSFVPSTINQNGISTLTYTIDNSANAGAIGNLDFTENLPTGLVVASPSNATTNCTASGSPNTILTAAPGTSTIVLDASGNNFFPGFEVLSAGATCTVSLSVQGTGVGVLTATSGDLLADFVSVGSSTATLTVIGGDLVLSKSFTDDPVAAGAAVTLDYTVQNNDRNSAATALVFSDDLNAALAGLTLDSVLSNSCGGSVSGAGTTALSLSGGTLAAQSSCTVSVSLTVPVGAATGGYSSTSSAVTATVNGAAVTGTTAADTLAVQSAAQTPPTVSLSLGDTVPGGASAGTFTLTNTATSPATDLAVSMQVVPPLPFPASIALTASQCGGTLSLISTGTDEHALQFTGGTLNASGAAGDSCTISFDITVPSGVTPGALSFTTSAPSATVGGTAVTGTAASDTMTIGGGVTVDLVKAFDATDGQVGGTVGLTFTVTNRAESAGNATDIAFTDDLDAFSTGAVLTSVGANDCGVTPTGTSTINVSGITLALGASCSIATTVTLGTATGSLTNTTSAPTAGLNGGPTDVAGAVATASLTVNTFDPLIFSHEFIGGSYLPGQTATLRYTIQNPNSAPEDATSMIFTHSLSGVISGLTATGSMPTNPCGTGSTLTGTTFLIFVGGNLVAGTDCTFDVSVVIPAGAADGSFGSVTSALTATIGGVTSAGGTSNSTLTIEAEALLFSKAFGATNAFSGSAVPLTFDIENTSSSALTGLSFTDDLENDFLSGATFLGQTSNTCTGGSLSGQGTGVLGFTGGTLGANASCSIVVNVQLPAGAAAGDYTNSTSAVTATAATGAVTGNVANADLTVFDAAAPTFSKSFDGPTTATGTAQLTFTISNPSTTLPISDLAFTDDLNAMLSGATASSLPAAPCGAGSTLSGSSSLAFMGGTIAPLGSCTFSVAVQIPASATAGSYTNTTSDLTRNGLTITSAATAGLTIESPPSFAKVFSPASIAQGATSTLTFTVDNTGSSVAASSLAFVDTLPTGVTVVATPSVTSTCGVVSATANSGTISLSGGSVAAGASCTVAVDVTSSTVGAAVNTTGDLTSSSGNSGTASATLTVTAAPAPSFSKAFGAGTFEQGGSTSLTFTINNTAALIDATSLAFTDTLPAGMIVATPPNSSSTCGTISATAGSGSISLSGGTATAGASCTIAVDVTSSMVGAANNVSGALTSSAGNSGTATASVTVTAAPLPGFAKAFGAGSIVQGGVDTVTFTIDNTALIAATGLTFSDTFPSGMTVAATPNSSSTCTGGAITAAAGSASMSYSGGSVAAGSSCTVSFDVTSASVGAVTNTSSTLVSGLGASPAASASFSVTAAPLPGFAKAFGTGSIAQGGVDTVTFSIDNTALITATSLAFSDTFPTGMVVAATPNASTTCTGGAVTATVGAGSMSYSGGSVGAGTSCTLSFDITSATAGAVTNTSSTLASNLGTSPAASANFSVTAAPTPGFSKAFGPSSIVQGDVTTLTFSIDNSGALVSATALDFTDPLPTSMTVAATPNASTTCTGGTLTATAGAGTIGYTGGTAAQGASCTVSVDVTSATQGVVTNTTGNLTSDLGSSGTASASLSVTATPVPTFSKAFGAASIVQGATTTLTFTVDNTASLIDASSLAFSDTFPSGMTVASTPNSSSTCTGGAITATAGAGAASYAGGTVAAGTSCTVSLDVTAVTVGSAVNVSDALSSSSGTSGTATDTLSVTATPVPTFTKAFSAASIAQGATTTLTFTVDNTASLIAAASLDFSDTFPSGMTVAATPNSSSTCTGGAITATAGAGVTSYAGGTVAAGASCTVSVDVTAVEVGNAVNVSAALSSSSGASGTATDTLTVTAASAPGFAKGFTPASIEQGATSTLTFTIDNSAPLVAATSLDFSDTFPTGMTVAATPNASTTCTGGTLTATAGAGLASYTGGSVAATSTCTVSLDVTSTTVGAAANTSGALTSSQGSSGTASATLTVTAATAPTFSKAFSPSTIAQGSTSTLTYTIDNSTVFIDATALDFSDTFPSGMTLASSPNASTTCTGGTLSATAGSSGFGYTGGTVALGDSCTVSVDVNSVTVGAGVSTTGDLTSSLGNSGTASATLTVTGAPAPTFTKTFSPASILSGGTSRVIFTINNAAALVPATGLSFIDNFPAVIQVAATPNISSTCGGTLLAPSGSNRVNLSAGSLVAGGSCTVAVNVTATGTGPVVSTSNALTSSLGNSGTASATLTLTAVTTGQVTITQLSDVDQDFGFTSAEALLNFTISTLSGGGTQGPITLAAGSYSMSQIRPAGFGNTSITCSDSNSVGISSSGALTLNVEVGESVACTFASVDSVTPTREAINDFLTGRINQILSNEPSNGRRINRLKRGFGGSRSVSFARGNLSSLVPVNFDLKSIGSGNYSISGSLAQAQAAIARHPLSLDGSETDTTRVDNHRFDVWFEASYSRFERSQGSEGHFGIGYLGADFLVNQDLLVGFLVQYDDTEDRSATLNRVVSGEGWMAGPYVTARLSENLYFDGRIAIGRSKNFLNLDLNGTTGLANGRFSTSRWLIDASLVGDFDVGKWQMQPDISLSYMEETQKAFVDSLNVLQPEQTVSQGQLRFGPNFSRRFEGKNGVTYEPSFSVDGIYNFGNRGSGSSTATANDTKGARARVEAGLGIADRNGTNLNLNVHYDGIGQTNYESYGIGLKLEMKF